MMKHSKALTNAVNKLTPKTVAKQTAECGIATDDPLTCAMDALYQYAVKHRQRYGAQLSEDYFCGPAWLQAITGVRTLLSSEGLFDAGTLETVFWAAMEVAGYTEADL